MRLAGPWVVQGEVEGDAVSNIEGIANEGVERICDWFQFGPEGTEVREVLRAEIRVAMLRFGTDLVEAYWRTFAASAVASRGQIATMERALANTRAACIAATRKAFAQA